MSGSRMISKENRCQPKRRSYAKPLTIRIAALLIVANDMHPEVQYHNNTNYFPVAPYPVAQC